ncbi:MAG: hydroxymethylbilane synthase [Thermoleophilaceae bacterium]
MALAQARMVAAMLGDECEVVEIQTSGDRAPREGGATPRQTGDKSRFVKEIEEALLRGEVDVAVHSAKDVPGLLPDGLEIAAVPRRANPRDVICGAASIDALNAGARVGTASVRRRSQLLALRPELEIAELRGNVDTRLRKLAEGGYDAIVLAGAGLERLGRPQDGVPVPVEQMVPAPGQGSLAIEIRADDDAARAAVIAISDRAAVACLEAERECVIALEATCDTPVGVLAECVGGDPRRLRMRAYAGARDGSTWVRDDLEGGRDIGARVAERLLAAGAADVLAS